MMIVWVQPSDTLVSMSSGARVLGRATATRQNGDEAKGVTVFIKLRL